MIELKDNKIWLYSNDNEDDDAKLPSLDFTTISAYICPSCNRILAAYFIGTITEEIVNAYNKNTSLNFQVGATQNGSYIKNTSHGVIDHQHRRGCTWKVAPGRDIKNCLLALCDLGSHPYIPNSFIDAIENGETEELGLTFTKDICKNDDPILLYDIDKICHEHYSLEREEHLADEITKLMQPFLDNETELGKPIVNLTTTIRGKKRTLHRGQTTLF